MRFDRRLAILLLTLWIPGSLRSEGFQGWRGVDVADDRFQGGNSNTRILESDSVLRFVFAVRPSGAFPFSGVKIPLDSSAARINAGTDLRSTKGLRLRMAIDGPSNWRVVVKTIAPDLTTPDDPTSYRYFELEIPTLDRDTILPWAAFQIPAWWATGRAIPSDQRMGIGESDLARVAWIELLNGYSPRGLDSGVVVVRRLETVAREPDQMRGFAWLIPLAGGVLGVGLLAFRRARKKRKESVPDSAGRSPHQGEPLQPDPLHLSEPLREDLARFRTYLETNYMNPDLSLDLAGQDLKLSPNRISVLLRDGFAQNFKSLLNDLRLAEAARQLRETSHPIQDVAFAVGYNHIAHFNRLFREKHGCTPGEFRKSHAG